MTTNTTYQDLGRKAIEAYRSGDKELAKGDRLFLYTLVVASEQATLSFDVKITDFMEIDGNVERQRMVTLYDTILFEVFGMHKADESHPEGWNAADKQRLRRMLPVACYVIQSGGTKCMELTTQGNLKVTGECAMPDSDDHIGAHVLIGGTGTGRISLAQFSRTAKREMKIESENGAGKSTSKRLADVASKGLAPTVRLLSEQFNGYTAEQIKSNMGKETEEALRELLIVLCHVYSPDEAMRLANDNNEWLKVAKC